MLPERIFATFQTASQGLAVQREKLATASRNIANAQTSAPKGSGKAYRPQAVRSLGPGPQTFKKVMVDSLSPLKRTNPKHISSASQRGSLNGATSGSHLGPTFEIAEKEEFRYEYDPQHPDADENGMVRYPDVDMVREMAQMVSANRLYEANLSSIEAEKQMIKRSLEI